MVAKNLKLILILLAIGQTLFLASMLINRNLKLVRGTEVVLESRMIDPRDIFRGHYVNLQLAISNVPVDAVTVIGPVDQNDDIFVTLKWGDGDFWTIDTISTSQPTGDQPFLKARARFTASPTIAADDTYRMRFPFDRYFAEKKNALALEKIYHDGKLGIIVMVSAQGDGAIKGLIINGEKIYDEPLF